MNHLFSVIIPTYKRPDKIIEALNSILKQTKFSGHFEVVIVNDGPSDGYNLDRFSHQLSIKYLKNETNLGVSASRNRAAREAGGEWLVFLDDDDQLNEDYFYKLNKKINEHPHCQCFWSDVEIQKEFPEENEKRTYYAKDRKQSDILKQFLSIGLSFGVAMKKELFFKVGMLDASLKVGEDTDLFLKIIGVSITPLPLESLGVIKHEEHSERLSFSYQTYSELEIYESIFDRHHSILCKHMEIYSALIFWAYQVHLKNFNKEKGDKLFDRLVSIGFSPKHILDCYSKGVELEYDLNFPKITY